MFYRRSHYTFKTESIFLGSPQSCSTFYTTSSHSRSLRSHFRFHFLSPLPLSILLYIYDIIIVCFHSPKKIKNPQVWRPSFLPWVTCTSRTWFFWKWWAHTVSLNDFHLYSQVLSKVPKITVSPWVEGSTESQEKDSYNAFSVWWFLNQGSKNPRFGKLGKGLSEEGAQKSVFVFFFNILHLKIQLFSITSLNLRMSFLEANLIIVPAYMKTF